MAIGSNECSLKFEVLLTHRTMRGLGPRGLNHDGPLEVAGKSLSICSNLKRIGMTHNFPQTHGESWARMSKTIAKAQSMPALKTLQSGAWSDQLEARKNMHFMDKSYFPTGSADRLTQVLWFLYVFVFFFIVLFLGTLVLPHCFRTVELKKRVLTAVDRRRKYRS